jgi:hypothetical protein
MFGDWLTLIGGNIHNHDMLDRRFELKEDINREKWEAIIPKTSKR